MESKVVYHHPASLRGSVDWTARVCTLHVVFSRRPHLAQPLVGPEEISVSVAYIAAEPKVHGCQTSPIAARDGRWRA